jgi:hypothetical protein
MVNSRSGSWCHLEQAAQIAEAMPSAGAARRSEPDLCAVPRSNSSGPTIRIAFEELMASPINVDRQLDNKRRPMGGPLNWSLVAVNYIVVRGGGAVVPTAIS